MEDARVQAYVRGLERKIRDDHLYLKGAVEELRDLCRIVSPEKNIPHGIVVDIRELYKEIQNRFKEIHAIEQLMQGKYRQFYRRDPLRAKDLIELGFVTKTTISRFEENLKLFLERQKAKEKEKASRESQREKILQWFNARDKQIVLLRTMRTLKELNYTPVPGKGVDERRGVEGIRSLTLFLIHGEAHSLDSLQSQMSLREHDLMERYNEKELRGLFTHLKEVDPSEIERVFRLMWERKGIVNLRCVLIPIFPEKDIDPGEMDRVAQILKEMKEGEIRTFSI